MFIATPPTAPPDRRELSLIRAVARRFDGPAEFMRDPVNRARTAEYLGDLAAAYGRVLPADRFNDANWGELGQSYGEMAESLIPAAVPADEPVDLLILAFAVHDLRPGRQTAAYLSDVAPGAPLAFAICDQGSAAAFSGLRIVREYAASAGIRRALLIVVEQAALPYDAGIPLPAQHQGIALLFGAEADGGGGDGRVRLGGLRGLRQHSGVAAAEVAELAATELAALAADRGEIALVISETLAEHWSAAPGPVRVASGDQPATAVWSALAEELTTEASGPRLVVAGDYDPALGCLSLASFAA